ncbi:Uncharacterized protein HZ326_26497, partial [Fusarium oxysporum f. sp. albedinis]
LAEIDTETFAGAIMVPKAKCQARSLAIDAGWQVKGHNAHIGDVEVMNITGALEAAISVVSQQPTSSIRRYFPIPPLDSLVRQRSHELVRLGVALSLIWAPGHSGVKRNCQTHATAKRMAKLDRPDLCQSIVSIPRSMDDVVDFGFHHE